MPNTKLSIITINYNNLEGLKKTVTSVVNQTWQDFEYIIIDGGSTDGSAAYIESQSKQIDYWVSEPDKGIYNAMNKGISRASGEYLLFLNSGDELFSNSVLIENYEEFHTEEIIYFDINQVYKDRTNIFSYPSILDYTVFLNYTIGHPTTLIMRSLFYKFGFYDEGFKIVSDWKFFFMVIIKYQIKTRKVNKVLSSFYYDGISTLHIDEVEKERNLMNT